MEYYFRQLMHFAQANSLMFYLIVICSVFVAFVACILWFGLKKKPAIDHNTAKAAPQHTLDHDINAIAGDDYVVTQLDLARAYIELDKQSLAREILEQVIEQAPPVHRQTAKELMATL